MSILVNKHTKVITQTFAALLAFCPQLVASQTVKYASPAEFSVAAAACLHAVSPDKLDTGKLEARGWKKTGSDKMPLGDASVFGLPNNNARILAGVRPSSFCIVDAYSQNADEFEAVQAAIGARLESEYGANGLTDIKSGDVGTSTRRQGFAIGNGVAALTAKMRQGGLNLRFTSVNKAFAGSPTTFQTSRPPLSEAEMAENGAAAKQQAEYANGVGSSQDILPLVNACATALRTNSALAGDGWNKSTHGSGTPRSVSAIKNRDIKSMMAGMAHTRQILYREGQRGLVTKYFFRGTHVVCEALIKIDPAQKSAIRDQVVAALGLGKPQKPSAQVKEFAAEYAFDDMGETFAMGASTVALHAGEGASLEKPDPTKPTFNVFVF